MNFFEQELKKIVSPIYPDATYVGRACYVQLGGANHAKLQFVTLGMADRYEGIKATLLNQKEGTVDSILLRFSDLLGNKKVNSTYIKDITPYIWTAYGKSEWYAYKPTRRDYQTLTDTVSDYLKMFQMEPQTMEYSEAWSQTM